MTTRTLVGYLQPSVMQALVRTTPSNAHTVRGVRTLVVPHWHTLPTLTGAPRTRCAICLESHVSRLRRLPCMHEFHAQCVDQWLRVEPTCPVCKHPVASLGGGCTVP
jgi:hypothetical protein